MEPGQIVGRYELVRRLGRGAFGETFLAREPVLDRLVVLKLASEDSPDALGDATKLLQAEARTAGRMSSPHIAAVYEIGREENSLFLVREFVEGTPLSEILREKGGIPLEKALWIIRVVAAALSVAHRSGFIHRDIKPSNIILRRDDFSNPVLLDFGVSGALNPRTNVTISGQAFGTIPYMSPEQIMARPQSAATDIYGLGVLLYEMLYGRTPFQPNGEFELFRKIVEEPVAFPAEPAVPNPVKGLISQCLDKKAENRPQTAEYVIEAVDSILSKTQPTEIFASSPAAPRRSAARRSSSLLVGGGAFLLLLMLLSLTLLTRPTFQPAPPPTSSAPSVSPAAPPRSSSPAPARSTNWVWTIAGTLVAASAFPLGFALRSLLRRRKDDIDEKATHLLFGAKSRKELTETLAIEVDKLVRQLDRVDERIVGLSIAIMVDEFRRARKGDERQKALMQVMELMEKIRYRLTPWYVRHDKLIAIVLSALTCVTGIATAVANILKPPAHP